jgi:intracellular multiplication protein IcmP
MAASSGEDPAWHLLFFVAVISLLIYLIWYFFKIQLLEIVRYVRLAELGVLSLFDSQARACLAWLQTAPVNNKIPTPEVIEAAAKCYGIQSLKQLPPAEALHYYNISPSSMSVMTTIAMRYIRWIAALACAAVGIHALYFSMRNKFKTRHTLESFIKTQVKMWPVIAPIVDFIPTRSSARIPGSTVPDKLPPFAEALSPEEWLSYHRISIVNGIPDRDQVRKALFLQLGPRWQGLDNCPLYFRALFAAVAMMGALKRDESEDLLGRLAKCWSPGKNLILDDKLTSEVDKLLKDPEIGGKTPEIANKYAYRTTAMLGVLKWARFQGGVLAPATFLWLRGQDRNLWYPLNNLGRRSFHTEGAGAMAHFMAEEAAGKPLPIPRIDTAIVTINQYLAANPGIKIPPREGSKLIEQKSNGAG